MFKKTGDSYEVKKIDNVEEVKKTLNKWRKNKCCNKDGNICCKDGGLKDDKK